MYIGLLGLLEPIGPVFVKPESSVPDPARSAPLTHPERRIGPSPKHVRFVETGQEPGR